MSSSDLFFVSCKLLAVSCNIRQSAPTLLQATTRSAALPVDPLITYSVLTKGSHHAGSDNLTTAHYCVCGVVLSDELMRTQCNV